MGKCTKVKSNNENINQQRTASRFLSSRQFSLKKYLRKCFIIHHCSLCLIDGTILEMLLNEELFIYPGVVEQKGCNNVSPHCDVETIKCVSVGMEAVMFHQSSPSTGSITPLHQTIPPTCFTIPLHQPSTYFINGLHQPIPLSCSTNPIHRSASPTCSTNLLHQLTPSTHSTNSLC